MNLFENAFNRLLAEDNTVAGALGPSAEVGAHGGDFPGGGNWWGDNRMPNYLGSKVVKPRKKPKRKNKKKKSKRKKKKVLRASVQVPIQTRFGLSGSDKPLYGGM
jgi:hypothetical protein